VLRLSSGIFFFFLSFYEVARAPFTYTSAEACLTGWPNAQPQTWNKCSVARHHQACLTVCVKCRCCATSLFSRNGLHQPACLQPGQIPHHPVSKSEFGPDYGTGIVGKFLGPTTLKGLRKMAAQYFEHNVSQSVTKFLCIVTTDCRSSH